MIMFNIVLDSVCNTYAKSYALTAYQIQPK